MLLHFIEQLLLVLGLSMDGFAASVCMGVAAGRKIGPVAGLISGFHVLMLLAGYALGAGCPEGIAHIYPWLAAALLTGMGLNMMRQAGAEEPQSAQGAALSMAALAMATSVDALTVGVAFAFLEVPAGQAGALVAADMGSLSLIGAAFGSHFGAAYRRAARLGGGLVLCLLGIKLVLSCLGVVSF
ncbi:MAG: manganese efflux pump [Oscillospiraceae bacterium]|nr:manganese efflux pump [Oscillospiraceae bacterium]